MSTPTTPTTVEVGQIWRDNDQRTKRSGEFVVLAVTQPSGMTEYAEGLSDLTFLAAERIVRSGLARSKGGAFVVVNRDGRVTRIRTARLLKGTNTQRGYTYLGREK